MGTKQTHRRSEETPIVFPATPWLVDGNRFEPLLEVALARIKAQDCPDVVMLPPFLSTPFPPGTTFNAKEQMGFLNTKLNEIIETFRESNATHLWFVDADAEVPPDALHKLLEMDVDIASGISPPHYSIRKSTVLRWMPPASPEYEWSRPWYKAYPLWEVYGKILGEDRIIATGHFCMLCKRRVFEAVSSDHEPLRFIYEPPQRLANEVLFWQSAQELGFTCRINGNVLCGHLPQFPLEMVQEEYGQ
jgi:hypothetical protein